MFLNYFLISYVYGPVAKSGIVFPWLGKDSGFKSRPVHLFQNKSTIKFLQILNKIYKLIKNCKEYGKYNLMDDNWNFSINHFIYSSNFQQLDNAEE